MKTLATLVIGIGALTLAACGGSDSKSGSTATPPANAPNAAVTTSATAALSASATPATPTVAST
ncbi:MAG: hypothetical protein ABI782_06825, partial [Anaerolineaceae bacterium]